MLKLWPDRCGLLSWRFYSLHIDIDLLKRCILILVSLRNWELIAFCDLRDGFNYWVKSVESFFFLVSHSVYLLVLPTMYAFFSYHLCMLEHMSWCTNCYYLFHKVSYTTIWLFSSLHYNLIVTHVYLIPSLRIFPTHVNGWQLAKMKKSIPDMSLPWNL